MLKVIKLEAVSSVDVAKGNVSNLSMNQTLDGHQGSVIREVENKRNVLLQEEVHRGILTPLKTTV